jgi:hypothetical protein
MGTSIYSKLADARVLLQGKELKKSGHNKHLGFKYMELDDFLPAVNEINKELKMLTTFSISVQGAILTVVDCETEKSIEFSSHIADAKLQGKPNPIQELGSLHTYMRRYMYMLAYEITEPDTLDPSTGNGPSNNNQQSQDDNKPWMNDGELNGFILQAQGMKMTAQQAVAWARETRKVSKAMAGNIESLMSGVATQVQHQPDGRTQRRETINNRSR